MRSATTIGADIVDILQQADGAHVDVLIAEGEVVAAGVGIAALNGGEDLGQGHVHGQQLVGIGFDLILAGGAAEGGDVDDAGNLLQLAADEPVLRGLEFIERIAAAGELIAVNLADGRPGRELRLQSIGQGQGLETVQHFLLVAEVVAVEIEIELYVAETEDADGAHLVEVRGAVQRGFDGNGHLLFHLFGRPGGILGDDLDQWRRGIGIGFDVEFGKGVDAHLQRDDEYDEHDGAVPQQGSDQCLHA